MKKIPAMLLAVLAAVSLLAGCGSAGDSSATGAPAAEASTALETESGERAAIAKVALIADAAAIEDASFDQLCLRGIEEWCSANSAAYSCYQPSADSTDARVVSIAQAIADGADTVVLPGPVFGGALAEVMDAYPEIRFIAVDMAADDLKAEPAPNVACLTFSEEQAGYLAGYAAVREGYTKLGFLGGAAEASAKRFGYSFIRGADAAAAELGVDIQINYTCGGQSRSASEITAMTEIWYQDGTEVVFACGEGVCASVLEAARNNGGKVIGVDVDQSGIAPEYFLTSAVKAYQAVTRLLLDAQYDGSWDTYGGKVSRFSLAEGDYVGLPADSWTMERFTIEDYEAVKARIAQGSITADGSTAAMPTVSGRTTIAVID